MIADRFVMTAGGVIWCFIRNNMLMLFSYFSYPCLFSLVTNQQFTKFHPIMRAISVLRTALSLSLSPSLSFSLQIAHLYLSGQSKSLMVNLSHVTKYALPNGCCSTARDFLIWYCVSRDRPRDVARTNCYSLCRSTRKTLLILSR